MKKIGQTVCFLGTTKENARNGEGDFIRLKDGRILYAYSAYEGADCGDDMPAHIAAIYSSDEGDSFGQPRVLIKRTAEDNNLMCVTLLRMQNGDLGIFYLRKYTAEDDHIYIQMLLRRSCDEGESWSEPVPINRERGCFVMENARPIMLKSGRIVVPASLHPIISRKNGEDIYDRGVMTVFLSDDDGHSFYDTGNRIPNPTASHVGLEETGVLEMEDGRLFAYNRTNNGSQFENYSDDGGLTWTAPEPSTVFYSPQSPMVVRHVGNGAYTAAVFNPCPFAPPGNTSWGRTPLVIKICRGEGKAFHGGTVTTHYLEDDDQNGYCYPTIFDGGDYLLIAYYHSNNTGICLKANKIIKVAFSEIDLP